MNHQHSIYTHCWDCRDFGINLPNERECGNCGSSDTTLYIPEDSSLQSQLTSLRKELEEERLKVNVSIQDNEQLHEELLRLRALIAAKDEALRWCREQFETLAKSGIIPEYSKEDDEVISKALSSHGSNWTRPEVVEKLVDFIFSCKYYLHDGEPVYQFSVPKLDEALALVKKEAH